MKQKLPYFKLENVCSNSLLCIIQNSIFMQENVCTYIHMWNMQYSIYHEKNVQPDFQKWNTNFLFHVENSIETYILSRVKQITSPGWMHETSARTWCSGKTWRERVEREVGGGIGMGKTCKLKAVSFQCMTKFTTN